MKNFDFVVVGGGSAGYAAARTAAGLGLRTAVVEGGSKIGGLCILRGCMPSKTLIESANRYLTLRRAGEFGLAAENLSFSPAQILQRKEQLVGEFAEYREQQLLSGKFGFFRGTAAFQDAWTIQISSAAGEKEILRSRGFLISTGSVISHPDIPGLNLPGILDSDRLLETADVPDSVIVLGAGPVGLEAAHYYASLGAKTTIIQRSEHLLKGVDHDVSDCLRESFEHRGVSVHTGTSLKKISRDGNLFTVSFEKSGAHREVTAAAVFNGLGRVPATGSLNLDAAGVKTRNAGIVVQPTQQTSVPHIYAAGDVCGPVEIVHIAIQQGELAARNFALQVEGNGGTPDAMDYRLRVFACFTEPQVAVAGASEAELRSAGTEFLSAKHLFSDHGKSMVRGETEGFVKLLADPRTGEILGGSVIGPEASELIHEIVVAMRYRSTVHDFALVPHYHPTLSEIWTYPAEELAETCGKASIAISIHK